MKNDPFILSRLNVSIFIICLCAVMLLVLYSAQYANDHLLFLWFVSALPVMCALKWHSEGHMPDM